ncbi:unnamed protein product [Ambrosiozyma monospora]|uniref:Actin cytoskeleton-regulatory complex protein SLA1 n=1 Tax=Ambrosiozyma monospora TaxID=43982 RepID=A0A9W6YPX5_AMBMO|nr:unnamed protein product [Ambrosiozyma monospora]
MTSVFLGVYIALYDYQPQNEEEVDIKENDLLYVLEKSDVDDWWKVKKRVVDADAEEPVGLVPSTYIEPAPVKSQAVALYDYDKQTEEELTFTEGSSFDVYDSSDENWILVGMNGQFGFVPANYIEIGGSSAPPVAAAAPVQSIPQLQPAQQIPASTDYGKLSTSDFAKPPQRVLKNKPSQASMDSKIEAPLPKMPARPENLDSPTHDSEEYAPPTPSRPNRARANTATSRKSVMSYDDDDDDDDYGTGVGSSKKQASYNNGFSDDYFTWKVHEIEGKKKRKAIFAIGNLKLLLTTDGPAEAQEWSIKDLISYSNEKKHVFIELKHPAASYELHAGTKDSAEAIISVLSDLKSMASAGALGALQDIKEASDPSKAAKRGTVLFDFKAQSSDELSCVEGETVLILNDKKSKDWWMVKSFTTGNQGVVPSNYIKVQGSLGSGSSSKDKEGSSGGLRSLFSRKSSSSNLKKSKSAEREKDRERAQREVERQREADRQSDRERLLRQKEKDELEREKRRQRRKDRELRDREEREKIRRADEKQRQRNTSKSKSSSKKDSSKPNPHRVRTWIDRSGAFKVEAEFLGCTDGKIHLHKVNGVKIAVAATKLSTEDLEYVERVTGMSLDNYKQKKEPTPQEPSRPKQQSQPQQSRQKQPPTSSLPSTSSQIPFNDELNEYWFNFFIECGVDAYICDKYARSFTNEQMDQSILEDIQPALMRSLGLREGDILRVSKFLDTKFGRNKKDVTPAGGLFSGADGALKTNTAGANNEVVNGSQLNKFEDDAWAKKPASKTTEEKVTTPQVTGSIQDLVNIKPIDSSKTGSSLNLPIKPVTAVNTTTEAPKVADFPPMQAQKTNGTMGAQPTGALIAMPTGFMPITMVPMLTGQATGFMGFQPTGLTMNKTGQLGTTAMMPTTTFGQAQPTTSLMMPLNTGGLASFGTGLPIGQTSLAATTPAPLAQQQKTGGILPTPLTTFGAPPPSNGLVQLQPTGLTLQKTGNLAPINASASIPAMQPTMRTGGAMMMPNALTGGLMPNALTGGAGMMSNALTGGVGMPTTSFGQPAVNPMMNPALTGGLPQTSFGTGAPMATLPQTTFGATASMPNLNMGITGGGMATGFQPQSSFGVNQLSNMFANTSIQPQQQQQPLFQQQMPTTSFGGFQQQPQQQQLMSQATGMGFGNSTGLTTQATGFGFGNSPMPQTSFGGAGQPQQQQGLMGQATGRRANLANATADNPFGF